MKILFVCQHYWPESFQTTDICEALARRGHEVTALVGLPNYPSGTVDLRYRKGKNRNQTRNGVTIMRANEIGRGNGSPLHLVGNYYSYSINASRLVKKLPTNFDVVFAYQLSPVMMIRPAIHYKKKYGVPILLYCADIWPESMKIILGDRFHFLLKHYEGISRNIYAQADTLVVESPAFKDYFAQIHGFEKEKIIYIPQFSTNQKLPFSVPIKKEMTTFLFAGNIGRAQDIPTILTALHHMKNQNRCIVNFVGDGAFLPQAKAMVEKYDLANIVHFLGRYPASEMPRFYQESDACLLTLEGDSWVGTTIPSKLQGYMAAGLPIFAAVNGGARQIIQESGCGGAVPAKDALGLARLMDDFIDHTDKYAECGKRASAYFTCNFTKDKYINEIERLLNDLVR